MKRICPSLISVSRRKVSRHNVGTRKGSKPSMMSISASAVSRMFPIVVYDRRTALRLRVATRYRGGLPLPDLRYLKNSEEGSSTSTSFLPRKLDL